MTADDTRPLGPAARAAADGSSQQGFTRLQRSRPILLPGARVRRPASLTQEDLMARGSGGNTGGISLGGILVIVGIVVAIIWSLLLGIIIALVGLVAFGGFARGKWY